MRKRAASAGRSDAARNVAVCIWDAVQGSGVRSVDESEDGGWANG